MSAQKTGTATLPLHYGRAPRWLFQRMTRLAGEIVSFLVEETGQAETLRRFADPFWFQAFGCLLGFDWHSSGLTTTTCGAVKEALRARPDLGLFAAGGKGAASRRTPDEIEEQGGRWGLGEAVPRLIHASRMSAKVDNNAIQDGYQIYHHFFLFTSRGDWAVVQQGMNETCGRARRYHWLGEEVSDFTEEPHKAICSLQREPVVINLVAAESRDARAVMSEISSSGPDKVVRDLKRLQELRLPARHQIMIRDLNPEAVGRVLLKTYENPPEDFAALLGMPGVGAKTLRALALISELIYGTPLSWRDPARYSFAHGGKDGHPYPVDRETYDRSIDFLAAALRRSKVERGEREAALRRLHHAFNRP